MDDTAREESMIEGYLARLLPHTANLRTYRVLGRGISGAATYRVTLSSGDAVLKITPAGSASHVAARARREMAFYRHLATRVPPRVLAMYEGADALLLAPAELASGGAMAAAPLRGGGRSLQEGAFFGAAHGEHRPGGMYPWDVSPWPVLPGQSSPRDN